MKRKILAIFVGMVLAYGLWPWLEPRPVHAAGAFVQGQICSDFGPFTCALTGTVAGNIIVVALEVNASGTTCTVALTTNGSMTLGFGPQADPSTPITSYIFIRPNIAGGSDTATATCSGSPGFMRIGIAEFSGVNTSSPIDGTGAGTYNASPNPTMSSGNFVAGQNDFVVGWCTNQTGLCQSPGSGFSADPSMGGSGGGTVAAMEWKTTSSFSAGATFNVSGNPTTVIAIALKTPGSIAGGGASFGGFNPQ